MRNVMEERSREAETRARDRNPHEPCNVKGCRETPAEHKPFCLEHILMTPYAARVALTVVERARDVARAAAGKGRSKGPLAEDALRWLGNVGAATPRRLGREVASETANGSFPPGASERVATSVLSALAGARLAVVRRVGSRRGGTRLVASLTAKGERRARALMFGPDGS